jgi:signal peptide peptidase SppA
MSFAYGHIAQRLFNTPLMYDERKAEAFMAGLGGKIVGNDIMLTGGVGAVDHSAFSNGRPSAARLGDGIAKAFEREERMPFIVDGNVAVIGVEGTLVHKGAFLGKSSGLTSYQGLQAQIAVAARSPKIKGVVFELDSFGGEVSGGFETAAMIAQLSKAKPTIAILTDFAYSAAYLLASQTRQIVAPPFGGAGSIGVIMIHADYSAQLAQEGVRLTVIKSGAKKAAGNPYEQLPHDVAAKWQAQVDEMRDAFASTVARGRGSRLSKSAALKTEAEAFDAKEALAAGIIDAIADPSETYDAFVKELNRT